MSQVRKDILNGWKEIGGYVCRDRRTVERWEKRRGLPVRRMPGAGRATVYALTSELDEWLEKSNIDRVKPDAQGLAADDASQPGSQLATSAQSQPLAMAAGPSSQHPPLGNLPATVGLKQPEAPVADKAAPGLLPESAKTAMAWLPAGRRGWIALATVAAILISVLVLSASRPHLYPVLKHPNLSGTSNAAPYRSKVAGVDDLYLRGIFSSEQRTPESLERAQQLFSGAIAKDPNYAPAYAALANTYSLLREYDVMPDNEAYPKARVAAERAVALDPQLSDAHASLGFIDFFWSWDTVSAEREFHTAIELDPSSALAHHWYGSMLTHQGRYKEAVAQLNIAQRLEPVSAAILSTRALALGLSGHRDEAVEILQELVSESPGVSSPHAILCTLSKVEPRNLERFLFEMRRAAELRHDDEMSQVAAAAEPALHANGERAMWMAILATEDRLHPGASDRTFLMVEAETALGRTDAAFADLRQLAQRRDPSLIGVILEPTLSPLRADPRFGQLIASMGLPPSPK